MDDDLKFFLSKAANYCSKKETSIFELKRKLFAWKVDDNLYDSIIDYLLENNFIDEQRYASAYVNDKFKFNHWGRIKIRFMLESMNIESSFITSALSQIDKNEYRSVAEIEIQKKLNSLKIVDEFDLRQKLYKNLTGKGFEIELIKSISDECINKMLRKN